MGRVLGTLSLTACLVALAGCGGGDGNEEAEPATTTSTNATTERTSASSDAPKPPEVECPPGAANCESASGQILYVERVDPDGDGDAHFVLASLEGITAPGISVIDVRADLRPRPLPGPGDLIGAAGPVYEGSYGQLQIQADRLAVERAR